MNHKLTFLTIPLLAAFALWAIPATGWAQSAALCRQDVTVQAGDTLSTIAARVGGDQLAYPQIVAATNAAARGDSSYATIANPNIIAVGWKLCVPADSEGGLAPVVVPTARPAATPVAQTTSGVTTTGDLTVTEGVTTAEELPLLVATPGPDGTHPLSIEYLRKQSYPGSPLTIEQTLEPGVNYSRYLVSYRSEGLKINALLTVPTGEKPATGWPVVIFNHGYIAPSVYRTTERYIAYVDGFARNGYIVLRSDYRGHAFSEGEARGAYGFPDYTIDVLNAVASIKQYPAADPNRIGMWGHSMGGYVTARAMVVSDDIKAGVIWAGVIASYEDLLRLWRNRPPVNPGVPERARRWRTALIEDYGTPEENPTFWDSLSANSYLTDLSGPVQLHHGTADEDVNLEFSELFYQEVLDAQGVAELYTYPGDNHNIANNFNTAMQRSIAFFDRCVKGG